MKWHLNLFLIIGIESSSRRALPLFLLFTSECCAAVGKRWESFVAAVLVASFAGDWCDDGGGAPDGTDAKKMMESPWEPVDGSRANRGLGWSNTWPKCWGDARRPLQQRLRGEDQLEIATDELQGDGASEDDARDVDGADGETEPSHRRPLTTPSVRDSECNHRHGSRQKTATVGYRVSCCTNCLLLLRLTIFHQRQCVRCCCCWIPEWSRSPLCSPCCPEQERRRVSASSILVKCVGKQNIWIFNPCCCS